MTSSDSRGDKVETTARGRLAWPPLAQLLKRIIPWKTRSPRLLFLDDDPQRAAVFLAEHPEAIWVETVVDCLNRLHETWDEVHLDHDLGGRQHVGSDEVDSGMEVIRWMCKEPRDHLKTTRFLVHTHNLVAGLMMVLQMRSSGFNAEFRPFGQDLSKVLAHNEPGADGAEPDGACEGTADRRLTARHFWRWLTGKNGRAASVGSETFQTEQPQTTQSENCQ